MGIDSTKLLSEQQDRSFEIKWKIFPEKYKKIHDLVSVCECGFLEFSGNLHTFSAGSRVGGEQ